MSGSHERGADREPKAVALRYERSTSRAPSIVAKGEGAVADQILRLARANDIPVHEDPELLRLLAQSEPPEEIPVELYGAVASLLAYLFRLDEECGKAPGADLPG